MEIQVDLDLLVEQKELVEVEVVQELLAQILGEVVMLAQVEKVDKHQVFLDQCQHLMALPDQTLVDFILQVEELAHHTILVLKVVGLVAVDLQTRQEALLVVLDPVKELLEQQILAAAAEPEVDMVGGEVQEVLAFL
jgi:hypothetical protein